MSAVVGSTNGAELPPGFVRLADIAPSIVQDVRYAGPDNFTGRPVEGYGAAQCWLREDAARALAKAQAGAQALGFKLVVWDCYRPRRATAAFLRWARDGADQLMKPRYYPDIDKARLFAEQYISENSSHSAGIAVDLGLLTAGGGAVDFGSPFDLFDPRSATASKLVSAAAQANRQRLKGIMAAQGFANYPREWWHYGYRAGRPGTPYDIPITQ